MTSNKGQGQKDQTDKKKLPNIMNSSTGSQVHVSMSSMFQTPIFRQQLIIYFVIFVTLLFLPAY